MATKKKVDVRPAINGNNGYLDMWDIVEGKLYLNLDYEGDSYGHCCGGCYHSIDLSLLPEQFEELMERYLEWKKNESSDS